VCACASWCGAANKFVQHHLVSDLPGVADHLDACLVNPWGIAATATSPFWVSLNGSGLAGIYDGNAATCNALSAFWRSATGRSRPPTPVAGSSV
jgi:hypothetical protein